MATIIARTPKALNFSRDPIYLDITTDEFTGASAPYTPAQTNLRCQMHLYEVGTDKYITSWYAPYSYATKLASIDLSGVVADYLPIPLPDDAILDDVTYEVRTAEGGKSEFYVKFGDIYDGKAVGDTTLQTPNIKVVRGSSAYWYGFGPDAELEDMYVLHSYKYFEGDQLRTFAKNITKDQLELLYMYNHAGSQIQLGVVYRTAEGDSGSYFIARGLQNGLSYINISYSVLGIEDHAVAQAYSTDIVSYSIAVYLTDGTAGNLIDTLQYVIDQSPSDYDIELLYENGCGGMETIRCSGRHKTGHTVTKETYSTPRWKGSDFRKGAASSFAHRGGTTWELNTGYYSKGYIDHLQQLLYSDIWLIHRGKGTLIKYLIQTTTMNVHDDRSDLHNLTLQLVPATEGASHNTFNV